MSHSQPAGVPPRARLFALLALVCALGAVVVLAAAGQRGGLVVVVVGVAGAALTAMGTWWVVAHRGPVRLAGALLAVAAPVAILVIYARADLWPTALAAIAVWAAAVVCARTALRAARPPAGMRAVPAERPRKPVLIMNPKSGGGKVGRFGLVEKAEALGARVVLLDPEVVTDVAAVARRAVAEGADLLGVAGGDGTQARVAEVAAENELPFLVVSAGTRNHFAMDLGLDREDPARCLDALTDGEELRVDLGFAGGRAFVNTASFGVYAEVVQLPEYRDAKADSALNALPDLLLGYAGRTLEAATDEMRLEAQQALLVSNNPYSSPEPMSVGARRARLDLGMLGVVGIRVNNAAQAADVALRGARAAGLRVLTSRQVVIRSDAGSIPVAVDGEALTLPTPVTCSIRPGALRVRVPRERPGAPAAGPPMQWRDVLALAFDRARPGAW
ncbi:diacylglycerol/lipid kinase family protein [Streptomyces sp. NRRL F-4428]|uniref:diacylglycerol/lipid kinase family protein n=1 Tax=Streptomyces sp. NRRL F-4428 TaxID=1609137 RepID=UPI0005EC5820|nr:diacylglycerol kinase family protein [Streptomyces sp. NRRL F-4428]KJK48575.1 diacylglycerol kinase [Streptomyces sp. NRRL F-4428]